MTKTTTAADARRFLALYAVCAVVAVIALVIGVVGTFTNARQDAEARAANKARITEQARLLDCFDEFATDLAGSLPPVRKATGQRDDATSVRDDALQEFVAVLVLAAEQPGVEPSPARLQRFARAIVALDRAGITLDEAQTALEKARADNPYPPPPSTFCETS